MRSALNLLVVLCFRRDFLCSVVSRVYKFREERNCDHIDSSITMYSDWFISLLIRFDILEHCNGWLIVHLKLNNLVRILTGRRNKDIITLSSNAIVLVVVVVVVVEI